MSRLLTSWKPCLRPAIVLVAAAVIVACLAGDVAACPTCKDGVAENDPQMQSMAAGYYYSILFMLSMPVLILTSFGSMAYLSVKRARRAQTPPLGAAPATC
jgi:hypothetical protein